MQSFIFTPMTRESGFTLLHHYSCIVKFPFFCSCFYQSIVILSLKIYISYQSSIYKWDLTIDFTFEIETTMSYLHHTLLSQVTSTIVWFKFWNSWLKSVFPTHHNKFYGQIVFPNFLHEMVVSFTHQEFVQGTYYHKWQFTNQVKEHVKRAFEWIQALHFYSYTISTQLMCIQ